MKYIESNSSDVYYNLALEEYIFNNFKDDDYLLLWMNDDCVVLGKYQNIFEEVNCKQLQTHRIKAARRNSGGGTVFHDKGNLNFSFITDFDTDSFSGYDQFIAPIIRILNDMGVAAEKRNACDIFVGDNKISGNAQLIKKKRVLHHGTLLFDSDLGKLCNLLKPTDGVFESKAVKSVRSHVANIIDFLDDKGMDICGFKDTILHGLFPFGVQEMQLSAEDRKRIEQTASGKYSSWEWNFGASPAFILNKEAIYHENKLYINLAVEGGLIKKCELACEILPVEALRDLILGQRYDFFVLFKIFREIKDFEDFAEYLF